MQEAIAECQGIRNPNANTCIKLASYYTILDHMTEEEIAPRYSYSSGSENDGKITYYSETEFSQVINGMDANRVFEVMDEVMETIQVLNPRLYASVIRKLKGEG